MTIASISLITPSAAVAIGIFVNWLIADLKNFLHNITLVLYQRYDVEIESSDELSIHIILIQRDLIIRKTHPMTLCPFINYKPVVPYK